MYIILPTISIKHKKTLLCSKVANIFDHKIDANVMTKRKDSRIKDSIGTN